MTCRKADAHLAQYLLGAAVPPEVLEHFRTCENCRALLAALARSDATASLSSEEVQKIAGATLRDLKPVRPLLPEYRLFLVMAAVSCLAAALGAMVLGTAGWQALHWIQRFAVFGWLAVCIGLLAFSLGRQIVPGARLLLSPRWLVTAGIGCMACIFIALFHPRAEAAFVATGLVCLKIGLVFAIPASVLLWLILRRGAIFTPVLTGLTTGALAGLCGLAVLEIFCPNLNEYHVLAWHLGTVLVSTAAGFIVGVIAENSG
jgi:hypothetical protein